MSDDQQLDPSWFRISRFRPEEQGFETLLSLLKHPRWEVRWNAARELYFRRDARALEALMDLLKNDSVDSVRHMASQALGALYEDGIVAPLYPNIDDHSEETRIKVALARLKELGVEVSMEKDYYKLLIPHELWSSLYIEIGYLMAQLTNVPFPEKYSPLAEVPSLAVPQLPNPCVEFRESYPAYMKFFVYRQQK